MSFRFQIATGLAAMSFAVAAFVMPIPAGAGSYIQPEEKVHADSFGNLVVYSPAGYKRIIVGQGHLAKDYAARARGPSVVYLEDEPYRVRHVHRCVRRPALVHGRGYMYGLAEGELPVIAGPCK
jgi:hypothetical protein